MGPCDKYGAAKENPVKEENPAALDEATSSLLREVQAYIDG